MTDKKIKPTPKKPGKISVKDRLSGAVNYVPETDHGPISSPKSAALAKSKAGKPFPKT